MANKKKEELFYNSVRHNQRNGRGNSNLILPLRLLVISSVNQIFTLIQKPVKFGDGWL